MDAVTLVSEKVDGRYRVDVDNIQVEKKHGGAVGDTNLIKGIVLDKERVHPRMPTSVKNAKIALVDRALEIKKTEVEAKIQIRDPMQMQKFLDEEEKTLKGMVEKVKKSGANVVICEKGIDDMAQHYLAKEGIYAVRRVKRSDMEKLAKATSGKIITNLDDLKASELRALPNVLSPRERERIKQLADSESNASLRAAFTNAIDLIYDLTRNPNQVDADYDDKPDKQLRVGLITQIRDGSQEILMGPITPGPGTNFITWRTNTLLQTVLTRVTNVVQEQLGELPKALTAGLRPGTGYVTVVENDAQYLSGSEIILHVLHVTNTLFRGDLKVLPSDHVFDQRLTLRHNSDFGGEPQNYEFEWYYQPDQKARETPYGPANGSA